MKLCTFLMVFALMFMMNIEENVAKRSCGRNNPNFTESIVTTYLFFFQQCPERLAMSSVPRVVVVRINVLQIRPHSHVLAFVNSEEPLKSRSKLLFAIVNILLALGNVF